MPDLKTRLVEALGRLRSTPAPNYPIEGYVLPEEEHLQNFLVVLEVDDGDTLVEVARQVLDGVRPIQLSDEDHTGDQLRLHYAVSKVREAAQAVIDGTPPQQLEVLFVKREDYAQDFERIAEGIEAIQAEIAKVRTDVARPALDGFSINIGPIGVPISAVVAAAQQASTALASVAGIDAVALSIALRSMATHANSALRVGLSTEGISRAALRSLRLITERAAGVAEIGLKVLKAAVLAAGGAKTTVAQATVSIGGGRRFGWQPEAFGIDIGSSEVRIVSSEGVVVSVPTMPASPPGMTRLGWLDRARLRDRPIVAGILTDPARAAPILRRAWSEAGLRGGLSKHSCLLSVPSGSTAVERRALERLVATSLPASPLRLVDAPALAALGAGEAISGADGVLVVHIGAGRTQVAVLAFDGVVISRHVNVGGDDLTFAIKEHVYRYTRLILGLDACENIKMNHVSTRYDGNDDARILVKGFDGIAKLPKSSEILTRELSSVALDFSFKVVDCVREVLEFTPPELAHSIQDRGIILTGGGALLDGLEVEVRDNTGLPVRTVAAPELAVVKGLHAMLAA